ncbi:MAG: DUF928 domain-containing protein [Cyanobacteria bacterium J06627_15]
MKFGQRLAALPIALLAASVAWPAHSLQFPRTSDRGAPPRSAGAGTRGESCIDVAEQPNLTALLPNNSLATTYAADDTLPSSLFFYIPETAATQAELVVVDSVGEEVYTKTMTLPDETGIVQVTIPDGAELFTAGELYYWDFSIICDIEDPEDNVLVGGGIQRADADENLLSNLESADGDLLVQAEIYAAAGAWQESLALAAQMRDTDTAPWEEILTSVGLEAVIDAPILSMDTEHAAADCN